MSLRASEASEAISTVNSEGLFLPLFERDRNDNYSNRILSHNIIEQIPPLGIHRINQFDLLSPRPCLDLFLARDGIPYVCIEFKIHKLVNIIAFRETGYQLLLVLNSSLDEKLVTPVYRTVLFLLVRI